MDRVAIECAIGRIFRICSQSEQPGDIEEYERCRAVILDLIDTRSDPYRPNWTHDRMKGAQGDMP